jgi:hypothetical protein
MTLDSLEPVVIGNPLRFTIRITNTMNSSIQLLSLRGVYSTTYLSYGHNGQYANPDSDNHDNTGVIEWSDLTESFRDDLGPGASFTVVVTFTTEKASGALPNGQIMTTAIVDNAWADPGGGGDLVQLPSHEASDGAQSSGPMRQCLQL